MPFQFTPYSSPLTGSIAQTLQQAGAIEAQRAYTAGNAAANAALQSGNAWSGAIQGIGQTIGALPGQIAAVNRSNTVDAMNKITLADAQRGQAGAQAVAGMLQGDQLPAGQEGPRRPTYLDEQGLYDIPKLTAALGAQGFGDRAADLVKGAETINESITTHQKTQAQLAKDQSILTGDMAHGTLALMNSGMPIDQAMDVASSAAVMSGSIAPAQYAKVRTQILGLPPEQQQAALEGIRNEAAKLAPTKVLAEGATETDRYGRSVAKGGEKPQDFTLGEGQIRYDKSGTPVAWGPDKPPLPGKGKQSESFLLNGQPVKGVFDPEKGTYTYNGEDVTARVKPIPPASTIINPVIANDVKETVAGMKDGTLPPQLPGRASKEYVALLAEAKRQGFDLAGAATDWTATQKHIASLNNAQQLRLNQSVNALPELLDSVDGLAAQWNAGSFPLLNKANLALAKNGVYGTKAATIANQLDAQIADVTADLGNVYMGGNSPTDHALGLASKSLSADWDATVLHNMVDLARKNVTIRQNSMRNTGVQGASATNPYAPPSASAPAAAAASGRQRVVGPKGETGTVAAGTALPPGWKVQ